LLGQGKLHSVFSSLVELYINILFVFNVYDLPMKIIASKNRQTPSQNPKIINKLLVNGLPIDVMFIKRLKGEYSCEYSKIMRQ
jgi:hypothetical protein